MANEVVGSAAPKFSIGEAVSFGWNSVNKRLGFFIGSMLLIFIAQAIPGVVDKITGVPENYFNLFSINFLVALVCWVVYMIMTIGLIKAVLGMIDGKEPQFSDLFNITPNLFINYILASIVVGLITIGGLILLIVPGIIWMIKYSMTCYAVVDGASPMAAMDISWKITKGVKGKIFLLWLTFIGINILGMIALFVGLLWTVPMTMIASAFVYRKLKAASV